MYWLVSKGCDLKGEHMVDMWLSLVVTQMLRIPLRTSNLPTGTPGGHPIALDTPENL